MTPEITPEEASRLARQCLGTSYDESIFRQFAANLLPDAEKLSEGHIAGKYIPESFRAMWFHIDGLPKRLMLEGKSLMFSPSN